MTSRWIRPFLGSPWWRLILVTSYAKISSVRNLPFSVLVSRSPFSHFV